MPISTYQDTFDSDSLSATLDRIAITFQPVEAASSNAVAPPTVGQLWPRITQT